MSMRSATSACSRWWARGAVSSGVRRVEALTGEAARAYLGRPRDERLRERRRRSRPRPTRCPPASPALLDERRRLERELAEAKKALAMGGGAGGPAGPEQVGGVAFIGRCSTASMPRGCARCRRRGQAAARRVGRRGDGRGERWPRLDRGRRDRRSGRGASLRSTCCARRWRCSAGRAAAAVPSGAGRWPDGSKAADAVDAIRAALAEAPVAA